MHLIDFETSLSITLLMSPAIYQALMETAILLYEDYFCATLGPIH